MLKTFRDRFATICVAAAALAGSGSALAQSHVEVSLAAPEIRDPAHPAIVHLRIKNAGDQPVSILKWNTPFVAFGGRLAKSMFDVADSDGKEVPYRGSWAYFGGVVMQDFLLLYPGQVLEKSLDLELEYQFKPNESYSVEYVLDLRTTPDPRLVSSAERATFAAPVQQRASSGSVAIHFDDVVAEASLNPRSEDLKYDAQQELTIAGARLGATRRMTEAEAFIRERYVGTLVDGHIKYVFKPHPKYSRWFGTHDDSEPEFGSDEWGLNDNARVYETVIATAKRAFGPVQTIRCGCAPEFDERTAAHAEVGTTYTMHFCDKFFKLPLFDASGSQVGAMAHEYTHYNAFYPGTADYLYGYQAVQTLAKEHRDEAVRNADNFEYFYTDTTPYETRRDSGGHAPVTR